MSIPLICVALLGLLCILTGFRVSLMRANTRTVCGYPADPTDRLHQAVRAHGNTVEYAPILALLIYILSTAPLSSWVLWFMMLATFCRYLIVIGLLVPRTMDVPHPARFLGALGTYIFGTGLGIALLLRAFSV